MSSSKGFTTGVQTNLYYKTDFATKKPTYAQLTAADGLIQDANLVGEIRDMSPQAENPNSISFPVYGSQTEVRVAGQATQDDITFEVALKNDDAAHAALMGLAIGAEIQIAIHTKTADTEITIDFFRGTMAGRVKTIPPADVATVAFSIAPEQAPVRVNQV